MKAILLCLVLLVGVATAALGQAPTAPQHRKSAGFDPKRDAAKDIDNAIVKAKRDRKRILLDVGGEW